jgi:hypothetical protein
MSMAGMMSNGMVRTESDETGNVRVPADERGE